MFGGGGGGLDPRKMQQMMQQMGVDFDELDASEVVIRLESGEELYFDDADVTQIEAQGQITYQVVGEPTTREGEAGDGGAGGEAGTGDEGGTGDEAAGGAAEGDADDPDEAGAEVRQDDVELVAGRTGASEAAAREALEATDGDLAAAVDRLE